MSELWTRGLSSTEIAYISDWAARLARKLNFGVGTLGHEMIAKTLKAAYLQGKADARIDLLNDDLAKESRQ